MCLTVIAVQIVVCNKGERNMKEIFTIIPCHRIPERCMHVKGNPMPLCTRCFAMLIGYLSTPIFIGISFTTSIWIPVLLATPLLMDGFTQRWKWRKSTNGLRFLTGILFGIGQGMLISTMVCNLVNILTQK